MSKRAERLVNEAEKNSVDLPVDTAGLIVELMNETNLTLAVATRQIYRAVAKFRKNRPLSVQDKVRKSIVKGSGKPSKEELTFGEGE